MRTETVTVELYGKGDRVWSYKGTGTVAEDETLPDPFQGRRRVSIRLDEEDWLEPGNDLAVLDGWTLIREG
jgi:hypothetical protein